MKILITGGAGFIGYNYAKHRLGKGDEVYIFDNLSRSRSQERWKSLSDLGAKLVLVGQNFDLDAIFHLAAQTAVTRSFEDPVADFKSNLSLTLSLLDSLRKAGPPFPKFIYASTNKVYGTLTNDPFGEVHEGWPRPIEEDFPIDLRTPYGISKGAADFYCQEYGRNFGIPTVILRQSCVYGPYQTAESDQGWLMHFADFILQEMPITIFGDGRQVRDVLHINDLLDLYDRLIEDDHAPGSVYNVGGGPKNTVSIQNAAHLLGAMVKKGVAVNFGPRRADDQDYYVSDIRKVGAATGWKPEISVKPGLEMLVEWLQENPEWRSTKTIS